MTSHFQAASYSGGLKKGDPYIQSLAYSKEDDATIIITTYEPDAIRWNDYRRRI